nr:hypothetical protein [Tanacetum cinerariifolium]
MGMAKHPMRNKHSPPWREPNKRNKLLLRDREGLICSIKAAKKIGRRERSSIPAALESTTRKAQAWDEMEKQLNIRLQHEARQTSSNWLGRAHNDEQFTLHSGYRDVVYWLNL